ncbi:hypothetical protein HY624_01950 [Candidatus Uhrbacteria bacterium]|nr:hypothetical protein [Candidatus Uhrbacteria bacterium]
MKNHTVLVVLAAVMVVMTGGCKRNESRPFTRKGVHPASNVQTIANATTVVAPKQTTSSSHILRVPGQYVTLSEAVLVAQSGDEIELSPGTHTIDDTVEVPNGVTVRGAGIGITELLWYGQFGGTAFVLKSNTRIEDCSMRPWNPIGMWVTATGETNITVRRCLMSFGYEALSFISCVNAEASDVMILYTHGAVHIEACATTHVTRASLIRNNRPVYVIQSTDTVVEESILAQFGSEAILFDTASEATLQNTRNCVWSRNASAYYVNMSTNMRSTTPRGSDFINNPVMVNPVWSDFRLSPISPCLTAGANGGSIGSRFHGYAPAYKTDLSVIRETTSPSGNIAPSQQADVLDLALTADRKGDVIINGSCDVTFAWELPVGQNLLQTGDVSLVDLDTNQVIATGSIGYTAQASISLRLNWGATIPAGQTMRWGFAIDSAMFPSSIPITFIVGNIEWSDGRIQWIGDGRIPQIHSDPIQF